MVLDITSLLSNCVVLLVLLTGSGIYIWRLKLGSRNDILLFVLFTVYWMAPLMCREYTGQMHIAMNNVKGWPHDQGTLLWLPLTIYGIAGLIYRPLTDVLSYKMKSRKNVLYIALAIQFSTLTPFFFSQTLATNIIQSIGTGVGASIIGVFNLMFSEKHHNRKIYKTVSIMVIPPLLAELITGGFKSIICSFLPEQAEVYGPNALKYLEVMKYIWLVAIICITISLVLTILFKENRQLIFHDLKLIESVKTKADWTVVILISLVVMCLGFVRWICAGPSSVTQFVYLGEIGTVNILNNVPTPVVVSTKYIEGYLSVVFAIGQLIGNAIASAALQRKQKNAKWILVLIGSLIYVLYLNLNTIESEKFLNAYVYFATNILAGLGYGLIFPVVFGIMLGKHFDKVNIITPVGVFNTCLAGGITFASVFNNILKGRDFDMATGWQMNGFVSVNHTVNSVTCLVAIAIAILFAISYVIHTKFPPKMSKAGIKFNCRYEMEI